MVTLGLAVFFAQGQVSDTLLPTGVRVRPVGETVVLPSRPVDALFSPDGKRLYVKDNTGLRVLDCATAKEVANVSSPGGTSLTGMALNRAGNRIFLTSASTKLHEIDVTGESPKVVRSIELPGPDGKGNSFPCGVALSPDGKAALVCLSRNNSVGIVDLEAGKLTREVPVGIAPYAVALSGGGKRATVSLMGGPLAKTGRMAPSAGTPTPVDKRGVAVTGALASVDLATGRLLSVTKTPRQTSALALVNDRRLLAANANDDRLTVFDPQTRRRLSTALVKPDARLPFGSMPSAIATTAKDTFVALAGNNAVAVLDSKSLRLKGLIPTGWYPTGVAVHGNNLAILSLKGLGARRLRREAEKGRNSYDYAGTVQLLSIPSEAELAKMTAQARQDLNAPQILKAFERATRSSAKPVPVPKKLGEPSLFQHVVYVIKENRTYDQVFGDMKIGDGDPKLCTYPEEITPNHHAIAREFALLDNYYCNGVLSADGHSWATEGNVTPYLERAFGGFNRSYTFGDDPLTYSSTGFLWDRVLDAGLSFRNFGEMDYAEPPQGMKIKDLLAKRGGVYPTFKHNIGIERLRRYSDPQYPGWNMEIPDVVRIDRFRTELARFEKEGMFPNLVMVYLPQDHGGSSVTNRANVADNDLAVGQLVEMLSKSKFWSKMAVFINEDDPQGGFDHVDGHRSICLVASPYTRGRGLVSDFYNQTSVLHTMLRILGLKPLNQRDASSPLMSACFGPKLNLTPYRARPARIALDETKVPQETAEFTAYAKKVKAHMARIPLGKKTPGDEDLMNRYIWHEAKGLNARYPSEWAGPHGKGFARRGLTHVDTDGDDD
jgi:YVTN family beta-propeller protein